MNYNPQLFVPASAPKVDPVQIAIDLLNKHLSQLDARDQSFAKSLMQSYKQYGQLSSKQVYWVGQLSAKAQRFAISVVDANIAQRDPVVVPQLPPVVLPSAPVSQQLAAGFAQVVALFDKAAGQGLKLPKIRLETESGQKVILRRLGASSRYLGQISVTDAGTSFQTRKYFGRIDTTGAFFPAAANTFDVTKLLQDLASDPAKMAALYGHKTSHCCFCGMGLETRESVTVGYGPICAGKYGLPWGEKVESTYTCLKVDSNG